MNNLTTAQQRELDKWYTQYSLVNKRRPTWNELCSKAKEIMEKGVDNQSHLWYNRLNKRKGGNTMKELYREYKEARQMGMSVQNACEWAKMMRACFYNPFED